MKQFFKEVAEQLFSIARLKNIGRHTAVGMFLVPITLLFFWVTSHFNPIYAIFNIPVLIQLFMEIRETETYYWGRNTSGISAIVSATRDVFDPRTDQFWDWFGSGVVMNVLAAITASIKI